MFDRNRRTFITLLGSAVAALPRGARAQQQKSPTIGFLGSGTPTVQGQWVTAFVQRMRELGWIEGRNLTIEYRWAEGSSDRAAELAAEFVLLKVDVIVTYANPIVVATKQATSVIPIVFAAAADPLGTACREFWRGLAATSQVYRCRTPILLASISSFCATQFPISTGWQSWPMSAIPLPRWKCAQFRRRHARLVLKLGHLKSVEWRIFRVPSKGSRATPKHFTFVSTRSYFPTGVRISSLALDARLPTMVSNREFVTAGGLMSYGPNFPDLFRRASDYVDKILRGAKPGDIPVEQPTKFDLVISLKTAKKLGLTFSPTLLARADEVIE